MLRYDTRDSQNFLSRIPRFTRYPGMALPIQILLQGLIIHIRKAVSRNFGNAVDSYFMHGSAISDF